MKKTYVPVCPQCKSAGIPLYFPYAALLYECKNKHAWLYNEGKESLLKQENFDSIKKFFKSE